MSRLHRALLSLKALKRGRGRTDAARVWLVLWSHAQPWARHGDVWPGNKRISALACMSQRRVKRALKLLRESGLISIRWGRPPRARQVRRIITLAPGVKRTSNPRIRLPPPEEVHAIQRMLRKHRKRPGAVLNLVFAVYACACMEGGNVTHVTLATLQDMTGASHGSTFYQRLRVAEAAGLLEREWEHWGDGIIVADVERASVVEMVQAVWSVDAPRFGGGRRPAPHYRVSMRV